MTAFTPISDRVFVDSAAYFALANDRDEDHAGLSRVMARLVAARQRFFTTNYILHETHALLVGRLNRQLALDVLDRIEASRLTTIVRVSARDERRAREILRQQTDKNYSLTDATSFAVMERLRISQALTLDQHFAQFGWTLLYPATRP
jgi:predicted nucleic acid-binding protein